MQIGYCCNVHPGRTIDEVQQSLSQYSLVVKDLVCPNEAMGIGLWLSETASRELSNPENVVKFRDWLNESGLLPFTFNGFPFGDFHQAQVKHKVYEPTWADAARLDYSIRLAEIQDRLLPQGMKATISTLPLGWPKSGRQLRDSSFLEACASQLRTCAERFSAIEERSGRQMVLAIEPEPGCCLDTCEDVTRYFDEYLTTGQIQQDERLRRHVGVCHDICHSAVMFEDQATAIQAYSDAGIQIGKVQVSAAVKVDFSEDSKEERAKKLSQLAMFAEPRYLHQTSVQKTSGCEFYEDLPFALSSAAGDPAGEWRVHFHVPIFSPNLGLIETTQSEISKCLSAIRSLDIPAEHFEIETYAWNVLPEQLRENSLSEGIAKEFNWFQNLVG